MRKIIPLAVSLCFLLVLSAESSSPIPDISSNNLVHLLVQPQKKIVSAKPVQTKRSLKERLLLKWYKKKNSRTISEDEQKKKIILLGKLSLWGAIAAVVLVVVPLGFFLSALLFPTSLIFGIISLNRRKKLEDKSGVSKWPALIGIILSSLVILFLGSYLLFYAISGSD